MHNVFNITKSIKCCGFSSQFVCIHFEGEGTLSFRQLNMKKHCRSAVGGNLNHSVHVFPFSGPHAQLCANTEGQPTFPARSTKNPFGL